MTGPECDRFSQFMWLYISGELSASEADDWRAHIQTCDHCRIALRDARETLRQFGRAPLFSPPARAVHNVLAAVSADRPRRTRYRKAVGPVLALAALIILFLGNPESLFFGPRIIASRRHDLATSRRVTELDVVFSIPTAAITPEAIRKRRERTFPVLQPLRRFSQLFWMARHVHRATEPRRHPTPTEEARP